MEKAERRQSADKKSNLFKVAALFMLSKGAAILKGLKALKYAKFAITAITMSISTIAYGFVFGSLYFAAGFILLLLIHECGHVIAMKRKGISASAPVFIPFLGAAIFAKMPKSKEDEAYIGYGGPLIGTIGALACIAAAFTLQEKSFWSTLLHVLGNVGLFINLFNLIPARPLDGGRVLHLLGRGVVYCGFAMLALLALALKDMFFVMLMLFATDNMPVRNWVRRVLWGISVTVANTMVFVMVPTNLLSILCYCAIASFGFIMFLAAWTSRNEPLPRAKVEQEEAPSLTKVKWLVYYATLLVFIVGTMIWHAKHLPKEIHESSLSRFVQQL